MSSINIFKLVLKSIFDNDWIVLSIVSAIILLSFEILNSPLFDLILDLLLQSKYSIVRKNDFPLKPPTAKSMLPFLKKKFFFKAILNML